jgi:DNA repair protein RadA/Sms
MDTTDGIKQSTWRRYRSWSLILLGGERNRKKHIASNFTKITYKTLYVSGEESQNRIKMRAERITTSVTTVISYRNKTQNIFKQIEAIAPKS